MIRLAAALLLALLAALSGCRTFDPPPAVEPAGDEVTIFVPGIKGSFLVTESGKRAWLEAGDLLSKGDRSLALPPGGDDRFGPLRPDGVLTRLRIFPFLAQADIYLPWLEFGQEHLPGFVAFAYDWRLDATLAVKALARRIDALAAKHGGELRVNLVGHSLGGLISLLYVRYGGADPAKGVTWAGARYVKRLALVGAPFGGAPGFLSDIVLGDSAGRNERLLSREAMASFASAYELLPYPGTFFVDEAGKPLSLDADDPRTWERPWAALAPSPGHPHPARSDLLAARRAFREGLRDAPSAPPPADLQVLVVAGTGRPTIDRVMLAQREGTEAPSFEGSPTVPGDSRVSERSCIPPRPLEYRLVTTGADHVGLLNGSDVQEAIRAFVAR